jgi:hypothetical protein
LVEATVLQANALITVVLTGKNHGFLYFPLTFSFQTMVSQWKWCHPLAVPKSCPPFWTGNLGPDLCRFGTRVQQLDGFPGVVQTWGIHHQNLLLVQPVAMIIVLMW